ncbi:MAG: c-type cytochrome [Actinomycetota bacterium]|nr:c-type cytochrome [Actinomycetota bacterium]
MRESRSSEWAGRLRLLGGLLWWTGVAGLAALWLVGPDAGRARAQEAPPGGPALYQQYCASCHGNDGEGLYRGPSLVGVGAASADFYLRTGRMPLQEPDQQARRGVSQVDFTDAQIESLVDYVGSLGEGPGIPDVDLEDASLARGGELFRLNCAPCHNWDGKGGALVNLENAPPLHEATPTQVVETIRIGPGAMPRFTHEALSEDEAEDIAGYVAYLNQPEDRGGYGLAHWGPATEMIAGVLGLGALLLVTGWLGEREPS